MTMDEALDASPIHVAINTTGSEYTAVRRHPDGGLAAFRRLPNEPVWSHAPINHAAAVGVDTNAWKPVQDESEVILPAQ